MCTVTGLPVAWQTATAKDSELPLVGPLLDAAAGRGFAPAVAVLDRGYDAETVYETIEGRGIRPVADDPRRQGREGQPAQVRARTWTFAGSDTKRGASKWRCPTGECAPASVWVKAGRLHTLIPRGTRRWKSLYHQRGAVEMSKPQCCHTCGLSAFSLAPSSALLMLAC